MKTRLFTYVITLALTLCWMAWAGILINQHASWHLDFFVALTVILSIVALWIHHTSMPYYKIKIINGLARDIEKRELDLLEPLPTDQLPEEILPLIKALNHLLHREKVRLLQEHTFSSEASHELRTPLAGIRLQAQIAQRSKDTAQQDKALINIIKAIDRCTHLVDQLLTLSRLTLENTQLQTAPLNINALCEKFKVDYQIAAQKRDMVFTCLIAQSLPKINADADTLHQALSNLLDNAIAYTPYAGEFKLSASLEENGSVKLQIDDSGPGITEDMYEVVTAPFQKVVDGRKRGSGLGLAIVKRIVELHKGQMSFGRSKIGGLNVSLLFPALPLTPHD